LSTVHLNEELSTWKTLIHRFIKERRSILRSRKKCIPYLMSNINKISKRAIKESPTSFNFKNIRAFVCLEIPIDTLWILTEAALSCLFWRTRFFASHCWKIKFFRCWLCNNLILWRMSIVKTLQATTLHYTQIISQVWSETSFLELHNTQYGRH